MDEYKKMTAPESSVGADAEQSKSLDKESMKSHPWINADNWDRVYMLVAQERQACEDLQKQLAVAEQELKAAADLVGTAERVFGKTFVQDIIDRDGYQKAAKYLPNGAFTPNGQFLG